MYKITLGQRMKEYENSYDYGIIGRLPIIIRLDGKNFSKWTKNNKYNKPFDENLSSLMSEAMKFVASKLEGCVFAFTQSDEVSFLLRNDQSLKSMPLFKNRIQKLCSISSSLFTARFNHTTKCSLAFFDSRVFAVPNLIEAYNYFCWRQNDATKNSISAACYYEVGKVVGKGTARKLMHGLNQNQQQELLFQKAGINWNDYPIKYKRGVACYRITKEIELEDGTKTIRTPWYLDEEFQVLSRLPYTYVVTTYLGY